MFSNKDLKNLIIPLFLEQLLTILVGLADTFVISFVSEAAVSGVSLVNSFNTIFIFLFTALASGGAVIVSQYIGSKKMEEAGEAASQLLMISTVFSVSIVILLLLLGRPVLGLIFGRVEEDVMEACVTYLRISAYSYPALAVYNAGAALYRSIGKTSVTMYIAVVSNVINIVGNLIGVFVLHAGVAGVAYPSLIARTFSAAAVTVLCFRKRNGVYYEEQWICRWNAGLLRRILGIAVPNGVEQGIFQFVKVALSSIVALFGTYQIAANGIAQSIWSLAALVCVTMGPVFITVIGQCMGAGDTGEAEYYFHKLLKVTLLFSVIWNTVVFALTPVIMPFFDVAPETRSLTIWLVLIHNVFNCIAFPFADPLGKGLRAAGDIKFTAIWSVVTTIGVRLLASVLFAIVFDMGVIGIALSMSFDWCVRAVVFYIRFKKGKWKSCQLI
ncbi:MATE family efflux transporter [Parablautia intestinalis]|uniref:MATE family efflux transporter n=1 Tax=Parablautia intestinalis TaxID=2320100 RepID=UPI00256F1302|nr:MATE family efflux transporter [Parablautia intestinalis]